MGIFKTVKKSLIITSLQTT